MMHAIGLRIVRTKIRVRINVGVFHDFDTVFGDKHVLNPVFFLKYFGKIHRIGRQVKAAVRFDKIDIVVFGDQIPDNPVPRQGPDQRRRNAAARPAFLRSDKKSKFIKSSRGFLISSSVSK